MFVSVMPVLSFAQSEEGVMLLQKHATKAEPQQFPGMLDSIPADRIPPAAGYSQLEGGLTSADAQCDKELGFFMSKSVADCVSKCDGLPNCGGFEIPDYSLKAPVGASVSHQCLLKCKGAQPSPGSRGVYSYYQSDTTTTLATTTQTTTSSLYIYKPYDCSVGADNQCAWHTAKAQYCCSNERKCDGLLPACNQASAEDDPHITSVGNHKFDVYQEGKHEFLVLPSGASPDDAQLYISGDVKKIGERENDLWIRHLKVEGKWVENGPIEFKTNEAQFGKKRIALMRFGAENWRPVDALEADPATVPTSSLTISPVRDESPPEVDFAQSVSKKIELQAGSITVLVDYATSQKNGQDINHLDLHLDGLETLDEPMAGLLAGDISALQLDN